MYTIGDLELIPKHGMSHSDWLAWREEGIGGSDISILKNENPYASKIQLFYQKLGLVDLPNLDENESVHSGKRFERIILEDSCYFEPSDRKAYIKNFNDGKKINNHIEFNYIIRNKNFPWLISNIDGIDFNDDLTSEQVDDLIKKGTIHAPKKIVEIKTISSQAANMWRENIAPGYKTQVKAYALQWMGLNQDIYGEIYAKVDGVELQHHLVEITEEDISEILTLSFDFWQKVLKGREILGNEKDIRKAEHYLKEIAPEPDDSESYGQFLSENYLKKMSEWENRVQADEEILSYGLEYLQLKGSEKELKKEIDLVTNKIKKWMFDRDTTIVDCGENGKITYNKRLYINLK